MKSNSDILLGAFFVVFGLGVWLVLVPLGVEKSAFGDLGEAGFVGPKLLPTVASLGIAVVGGLLTVRALLVKARVAPTTNGERTANVEPDISVGRSAVIRFVAVCFGYVLVLYVLGYIIATILLLFSLQWLFGERRRIALVLLPTVLSIGLYAFFRFALLVRFPQGRLFVLLT